MKKKIELTLYRSQTNYEFIALSDMSAYGDIQMAPTVTIDIHFNLFDDNTVCQKEIEVIDKQIDELREESLRKIIKLSERRQELMAITYEQLP